MKARNGFVSNSSSSSFLIAKKEYPSTIDFIKKVSLLKFQFEMDMLRQWLNMFIKEGKKKEEIETLEKLRVKIKERNAIVNNVDAIEKKYPGLSPNLAMRTTRKAIFISSINECKKDFYYVKVSNDIPWNLPKLPAKEYPSTIKEDDILLGKTDDKYIHGQTYTIADTLEEKKIDASEKI